MDWFKWKMRPLYILVGCLWLTLASCASTVSAPSPTVTAEPELVSYPPIVLPISVYMLDDLEGERPSQRTEQEIQEIFEQVNQIWEPASIRIEVEQVERVAVPQELFDEIMMGNFDPFFNAANSQTISLNNRSLITGFYLSQLFSNGIAPSGRRSIFVIDAPTVADGRVTAHEIGHVLGLHHELDDETHLMYSGSEGVFLTEEEIVTARYAAQGLLDRVR